MATPLVYILAALAEIGGCFAFWAWLKLGKSPLWLVPGMVSLALFAWLLTLVPSEAAGRAYAAYGGVYIAMSLLWAVGGRRHPARSVGPGGIGTVRRGRVRDPDGAARRLTCRQSTARIAVGKSNEGATMARRAFPFRAAAFAMVLALPALAHRAAADDPFEGIPNVEISYYDVSGISAQAIRKSMIEKRLTDPNDGKPVDAVAHWRFEWRWPRTLDGNCELAKASIKFSGTVTMPRLMNEERLDRQLRGRWQRYITGLRNHEAGHLRYPWENADRLLNAIKSSDCANASAAAQKVIAEFSKRDRDYDRATRHGRTQGATFP